MKNIILSSLVALVALCSVNVANAQNPHLVKKTYGGLTINESTDMVCASGDIVGLGNLGTTADFNLVVTASYTLTCYNPATHEAVGQSKETATFESGNVSVTIDANGRAHFDQCATVTGSCRGNALTPVVSNIQVKSAYIDINNGQYMVSLPK